MISSNELFVHQKSVAEYMREAIEKERQGIKAIKYMTPKEREFAIFKMFYNGNYKSKQKQLYQLFKYNIAMIYKIKEIKVTAKEADYYTQMAWFNRQEACLEIMNLYNQLLNKMSMLAKEFNMNNSLELSIFYDYLLWNGYLSKTHKHEYKNNKGTELIGMHFADVLNGTGVCRHYSEMLKDFLNYNGYNSIMLANYFDYAQVINKMVNNKRVNSNHVFNLIDDNGLYIYDSTNPAIYTLTREKSILLAEGDLKYKSIVELYRSYDLCYSKKDETLLDRLFFEENFISPYNKSDLISARNANLEIIKNSTSLLEDFYCEAKPDIIGISEKIKKELTRIK